MNRRSWHGGFNQSVPLEPGAICDWKKHFQFALREVMGYLESMAAKNKHRFVWASVATITKGTNQYSKGKPYSMAAVKVALTFLVHMGIIARVRKAEWVNSKGRTQMLTGFVVAPHDMCCIESGGRCEFWRGDLKNMGWDKPGKTVIRLPDFEENLAIHRKSIAFYKDSNKL